jgi:TolA-binding protein
MPPAPFPVVASAAPVELVSSESALHGRLHSDVTESVLVPLVNQFSMMQQQMFDQFQQAMGMLVRMFSSMHREQMDVIREELDRLHELSRELQELKDELAASTGRAAASPAAATGPAPAPAPTPATPGAASPAPPAAPRRPLPTVASPPRPVGPRPDQRSPGATAPDAAAPVAVSSPQDAVAWIHHRIAAIQQERETRWQKILKVLPGMS